MGILEPWAAEANAVEDMRESEPHQEFDELPTKIKLAEDFDDSQER